MKAGDKELANGTRLSAELSAVFLKSRRGGGREGYRSHRDLKQVSKI